MSVSDCPQDWSIVRIKWVGSIIDVYDAKGDFRVDEDLLQAGEGAPAEAASPTEALIAHIIRVLLRASACHLQASSVQREVAGALKNMMANESVGEQLGGREHGRGAVAAAIAPACAAE